MPQLAPDQQWTGVFFYLKGNGGEAGIALRPLRHEGSIGDFPRSPHEARQR